MTDTVLGKIRLSHLEFFDLFDIFSPCSPQLISSHFYLKRVFWAK